MYLHQKSKKKKKKKVKEKRTMYLLCSYCKTLLLLLRWDTGEVRDRFVGMGRFKGGLRCMEQLNNVIKEVII